MQLLHFFKKLQIYDTILGFPAECGKHERTLRIIIPFFNNYTALLQDFF